MNHDFPNSMFGQIKNQVNSELDPELIAQYCQADYQIGTGEEAFVVRVNQYSERLSQLMIEKRIPYAAIITADNPLGQVCNDLQNRAAYCRLQSALTHAAFPMIESVNIDPIGKWPDERSVCVLGVDRETICLLGRQFGQNAIIYIEGNALPRLVLLR